MFQVMVYLQILTENAGWMRLTKTKLKCTKKPDFLEKSGFCNSQIQCTEQKNRIFWKNPVFAAHRFNVQKTEKPDFLKKSGFFNWN